MALRFTRRDTVCGRFIVIAAAVACDTVIKVVVASQSLGRPGDGQTQLVLLQSTIRCTPLCALLESSDMQCTCSNLNISEACS